MDEPKLQATSHFFCLDKFKRKTPLKTKDTLGEIARKQYIWMAVSIFQVVSKNVTPFLVHAVEVKTMVFFWRESMPSLVFFVHVRVRAFTSFRALLLQYLLVFLPGYLVYHIMKNNVIDYLVSVNYYYIR